MSKPSASGHYYRRKLPHFRSPGCIYHARLSLHPKSEYLHTAREFQIVQDAIIYLHKRNCIVLAWVIMPNHVHIIFQPIPKTDELSAWCDYLEFNRVEDILGSLKKYTARRINAIRKRTSRPFWQRECFDRIARNEKDLDGLVDYVHANPIRWELVPRPEDYPWSPASTIYSGKSEYRDWFNY